MSALSVRSTVDPGVRDPLGRSCRRPRHGTRGAHHLDSVGPWRERSAAMGVRTDATPGLLPVLGDVRSAAQDISHSTRQVPAGAGSRRAVQRRDVRSRALLRGGRGATPLQCGHADEWLYVRVGGRFLRRGWPPEGRSRGVEKARGAGAGFDLIVLCAPGRCRRRPDGAGCSD